MDISPVTSVAVPPAPVPQAPAPEPLRPGKSGQSVGHMAKQAVAAARGAGVELPSNAQGLAASQIAKGADPASVFAAQITPPEDDVPLADPIDGVATPPETVPETDEAADAMQDNPTVDEAVETASETALQYQASLSVLDLAGDSSAQTALDLLS